MEYFLQDKIPDILKENTTIDVYLLRMWETRFVVNKSDDRLDIAVTFESCDFINNDATAVQIHPEVWTIVLQYGATMMIKKIADKELLLINNNS